MDKVCWVTVHTVAKRHMSLSEGGGVFGREKLFGNSRCQVLYYFAGAVCPGCSHRRPQPGQLIKNRNLSLRILEAGKVQAECAERFSVW